ncbi:MAG: SPOR domain-containing protein [Sphingobacteriaceae bacterium]|nr:SPOR domain-containing protein [Sphingobacteriaceae bacterium]MBK7818674.1 SPOR domain-containing protein [Sphingobacteriaceae bacterium]
MNVHAQIVEGIKTLLHQQEYVVIPNFGGFVTQVHFSKYLVEKNILTPPGKVISFNKQLRQNDGVLVFWLQKELNATPEIALKHITEFSDYCEQVLRTKRRLNLENLGFFYLDLESNICFEPKNDSNYLLDSFGLSPVILNELSELVVEKKETEFIDRKIEIVKQELPIKRKRNFKPIAYIALGGSILFFSLAALVTINKSEGPLLSGIFNSNAVRTYKPLNYSELVLEKTDAETKSYVPNSEGIAVLDITSEKAIAVSVNENTSASNEVKHSVRKANNYKYSGKFQIVLGCFTQKNNADKMVRKLKRDNVNAGISGINNRGMHVVSCAGFDSKDSALAFLQDIKGNFPNAWIKSDY